MSEKFKTKKQRRIENERKKIWEKYTTIASLVYTSSDYMNRIYTINHPENIECRSEEYPLGRRSSHDYVYWDGWTTSFSNGYVHCDEWTTT